VAATREGANIEAAVRILLVEDEKKVAKALQEGLEHEGYSIRVAHTGEDGFYLINSEPFDLIILDVMLPGRSGLEILSTARSHGLRTPVLILTARDAVEDRVVGLDRGADDYLVKPFAFPELQARVRVLLRRGKNEPLTKLRSGGLEMDLVGRTVMRDGQTLDLTAREFELLEYLIRNHGRVVTREMLARDVWKENARPTPLDNVIDVHIARLRRKIDDPFPTKLVQTVRGVGFVVREEIR
jgi:DNA-binding response OmpR family regulator